MSGQFPQAVWKPSQKDLLADLNPQIARFGGTFTNAANLAMFFTLGVGTPSAQNFVQPLPTDKLAVLTWLHVRAVGGGAQTVGSLHWRFADPTGNTSVYGVSQPVFVAANIVEHSINVNELLVSPLDTFQLAAAFSAFAVANTLQIGVHGYIVPRGNWQFA